MASLTGAQWCWSVGCCNRYARTCISNTQLQFSGHTHDVGHHGCWTIACCVCILGRVMAKAGHPTSSCGGQCKSRRCPHLQLAVCRLKKRKCNVTILYVNTQTHTCTDTHKHVQSEHALARTHAHTRTQLSLLCKFEWQIRAICSNECLQARIILRDCHNSSTQNS